MSQISRRSMMSGALTGAAAAALLGDHAAAQEKKVLKTYPNEHFYTSDGAFDVEKAKAAYYEMFAFYDYPIVPRLKGEEFWAVDFGLGQFTEAGMAGIFWLNNQEGNYFGHEIYLLPGQMIPEHKHVKTELAGPKMEGWHVRYGWIDIYGEGEPAPGVDERIPPLHREIAKARKEQKLLPGEVGTLAGAEQWHWMRAGDQGAIVSEYATFHDGKGLRFSHPDIKF